MELEVDELPSKSCIIHCKPVEEWMNSRRNPSRYCFHSFKKIKIKSIYEGINFSWESCVPLRKGSRVPKINKLRGVRGRFKNIFCCDPRFPDLMPSGLSRHNKTTPDIT